MLWQEQSWPQIQTLSKQLPVVIPLGSTEQHGRHLPLAVDTLQVHQIASRVEQALPQDMILLPTLWVGSSHHHRDFPGTISLLPSLYSQVISQLARSVLDAGFRRIIFLNGHGGNHTPASQALCELIAQDNRADDAYLVLGTWWQLAQDRLSASQHHMTTPAISHACEYETSLMMAIRPDLVKLDQARRCEPPWQSRFFDPEYDGKVAVFRRYHRYTASGSMGQPAQASATKGRSLLDAAVQETIAFVKEFSAWPELPAVGPM